MAIAVVIILLVIGSVIFHFAVQGEGLGWWFTPIASNWSEMDGTVILTFWVTGIVFIALNLFLAYAVIKYRHRKGQKADYEPESTRLEIILTVVTSIGVVAMLAPGLVVWGKFVTVPEDAAIVEAVGQQWHWSFRFPGEDGELGTTDARLITPENPFGVNPDDPNGQDDVLVSHPELHLPIDRPVKVLLRSKDVLHDFAVPQFRVKMDLVPGMITFLWFTPTKLGRYEIMCEELCGMAHHAMRGAVVVDEASSFDTWLADQPTFAETQAVAAGDPAQGQALYALCTACHGQQGEGMQLLNAPKLAGQEPGYLRRQMHNYRNGLRGVNEADVYGRQMVPFAQSLADDAAINNVIAYIQTLPSEPTQPTEQGGLGGDAERGKSLYTTCAACHGVNGEGIWSQNAPALKDMSDWDLVRQLQNFSSGVRGEHAQDFYGKQMAMMATALVDDRTIKDLVAYINTL
jgi:cytochrome c oxidase subunit 2